MSDLSTPEQVYELMVAAAGSPDVVRLAALIAGRYEDGVELFTRPDLTGWWAARWPHHASGPGDRRPARRVQRALPPLTSTGVVVEPLDAAGMTVGREDLLGFLAGRSYMADEAERQNSSTLPVGQVTRDDIYLLVFGTPPPPEDPPPPEGPGVGPDSPAEGGSDGPP